MKRSPVRISLALAGAALALAPAFGQGSRQQRIDVQDYAGEIRIDPKAQTLAATVKVRFVALDDTNSVSFELNNALSLDKVTDDQDRQIQASRLQQDMSVRLSLPQPIPRGQQGTLTFTYDGKLTGEEESPVFGIKFAGIHPDYAYLLYPARWFPVNDYTTDRFTADWKVTVPTGYKVLGSGLDSMEPASDGMTSTRWKFSEASFPGSLAVVKADSGNTVSSGGIATTLHFRDSAMMAGQYGEEFARAMAFFTDLYGIPPKRNLVVVETEAGAPNGYSAPDWFLCRPRALAAASISKWLPIRWRGNGGRSRCRQLRAIIYGLRMAWRATLNSSISSTSTVPGRWSRKCTIPSSPP